MSSVHGGLKYASPVSLEVNTNIKLSNKYLQEILVSLIMPNLFPVEPSSVHIQTHWSSAKKKIVFMYSSVFTKVLYHFMYRYLVPFYVQLPCSITISKKVCHQHLLYCIFSWLFVHSRNRFCNYISSSLYKEIVKQLNTRFSNSSVVLVTL